MRGGDSGRAPGPSRGSPQLRPASGPPSRCSPPLPREAAGGSGAGGLPGAAPRPAPSSRLRTGADQGNPTV